MIARTGRRTNGTLGRRGDGIASSVVRWVLRDALNHRFLTVSLIQYAPYLRNYSTTLWTVSFAKFEGSTDPAAELLKKTWNVATGQE
jgi:hypothetical protein